jgi:2-oxoglutarate ferredoxin oxidoreductase subunit beta
MVYGLTKGQASPTSQIGFKTPVQVKGVFLEPFNPIALAVALDVSFVARAFSGDIEQTKAIIKDAISHKGFALVDIFQPCVSFNKVNTHQWFKENTYYLDDSHDSLDRGAAFQKAVEREKFPLGIFYRNDKKSTFEENTGTYRQNKDPLALREIEIKDKLSDLIKSKI